MEIRLHVTALCLSRRKLILLVYIGLLLMNSFEDAKALDNGINYDKTFGQKPGNLSMNEHELTVEDNNKQPDDSQPSTTAGLGELQISTSTQNSGSATWISSTTPLITNGPYLNNTHMKSVSFEKDDNSVDTEVGNIVKNRKVPNRQLEENEIYPSISTMSYPPERITETPTASVEESYSSISSMETESLTTLPQVTNQVLTNAEEHSITSFQSFSNQETSMYPYLSSLNTDPANSIFESSDQQTDILVETSILNSSPTHVIYSSALHSTDDAPKEHESPAKDGNGFDRGKFHPGQFQTTTTYPSSLPEPSSIMPSFNLSDDTTLTDTDPYTGYFTMETITAPPTPLSDIDDQSITSQLQIQNHSSSSDYNYTTTFSHTQTFGVIPTQDFTGDLSTTPSSLHYNISSKLVGNQTLDQTSNLASESLVVPSTNTIDNAPTLDVTETLNPSQNSLLPSVSFISGVEGRETVTLDLTQGYISTPILTSAEYGPILTSAEYVSNTSSMLLSSHGQETVSIFVQTTQDLHNISPTPTINDQAASTNVFEDVDQNINDSRTAEPDIQRSTIIHPLTSVPMEPGEAYSWTPTRTLASTPIPSTDSVSLFSTESVSPTFTSNNSISGTLNTMASSYVTTMASSYVTTLAHSTTQPSASTDHFSSSTVESTGNTSPQSMDTTAPTPNSKDAKQGTLGYPGQNGDNSKNENEKGGGGHYTKPHKTATVSMVSKTTIGLPNNISMQTQKRQDGGKVWTDKSVMTTQFGNSRNTQPLRTTSSPSRSRPHEVYLKFELRMTWPEFCSRIDDFKKVLISVITKIGDGEHYEVEVLRSEKCIVTHNKMKRSVAIRVRVFIVNSDRRKVKSLTSSLNAIDPQIFDDQPGPFKGKVISVGLVEDGEENALELATERPKKEDFALDEGTLAGIAIAGIISLLLLGFLFFQMVIIAKRRSIKKTRVIMYNGTRPSVELHSIEESIQMISMSTPKLGRYTYVNPVLETSDHKDYTTNPLTLTEAIFFLKSPDGECMEDEFLMLPNIMPRISEVPLGGELKNRYANVIPLHQTRVILRGNGGDDYINANYVRGYGGKARMYIATQAPMENTKVDFWNMIWYQQSQVIVMLTGLEENGQSKCVEYWPNTEGSDIVRIYGDFKVQLQKRVVTEHCIWSTLHLKNMEGNLCREVLHIWFTSWPKSGVPSDSACVLDLLLKIRPKMEASHGPTVLHCSPGTGRTGTLMAIDIGMRSFDVTHRIDVLQTVRQLREDRAGAVQTKEQYKFIYKTLVHHGLRTTSPTLSSHAIIEGCDLETSSLDNSSLDDAFV